MELRKDKVSKQCFCIGIIITVISAVFLTGYLAATSLYQKTEGVCVTAQRGSNQNYNVYEFTVNGTVYTYRDYCMQSSKTKVGDTFNVRYDPNDPNKTFDTDAAALAAIALGIGVLFMGSGLKKKDDSNMPMWAEDDPANKYLEKRK